MHCNAAFLAMESKETPSSIGPDETGDRSRTSALVNAERSPRGISEASYYSAQPTHRYTQTSYRSDDNMTGYPDGRDSRRTAPEEHSFKYELEMMKAREQVENVYRTPASGVPGDPDHAVQDDDYIALRGTDGITRPAIAQTGRPRLEGFSRVENGKRYRLVVVQHPSRARMCGFGDKDRRPLSPTLIVKLVITDEQTGVEINPLDVNTSLSLLATDLCHPDDLSLASRNILVHHQASALPHLSSGGHAQLSSRAGDASYKSSPGFVGGLYDSAIEVDLHQQNGGQLSPKDTRAQPLSSDHGYGRSQHTSALAMSGQTGAESYTRNLVGAAVASASVLKDEDDKWCIFFVFQDISVRTEGVYRIKLMFVNLEVNGCVGTGVAEALAEVYTDPFTVYSPRRFPGMLDPTPLSRKLASQGIKIPVRNDKKKQRKQNDDDAGPGDDDGGSGVDDEDE